MRKVIVEVHACGFAQFGFRAHIVLRVQQIETQIPMRRCLQRVQANRIAIMLICLCDVVTLCLCDPQQILNRRITRRNPMRLFQLDKRLIKSTVANECDAFVQCRGLSSHRRDNCEQEQTRRDPALPCHHFAPAFAASSVAGAAMFSLLITRTSAKILVACAVLPSARSTKPYW